MNLDAFGYVVDHVVRRANRSGECVTVVCIGLEAPGSAGPDPAALYRVARVLRSELRGEDVVARVGEAEFAVALPDTDASAGEVVVAWIEAKLAEHDAQAPGGPSPVVIGRATLEPEGGLVKVEELLDAARASTRGPSSLHGVLPAARPIRTLPGRPAGRRQAHLRALHPDRP
jgi:hypothetical protein